MGVDGMVRVAFQTSYSVPLMVMFWSNGMPVSTGPVVVPDPVSNKYARAVDAPDTAGMQGAEAQGHGGVLGDCAFLIAIEGIEVLW